MGTAHAGTDPAGNHCFVDPAGLCSRRCRSQGTCWVKCKARLGDLAGYVLKVGLEKGDKTPHELLIKSVAETRRRRTQVKANLSDKLRCVLILTAVVPKQLPIQTAMAVNTVLPFDHLSKAKLVTSCRDRP